MLALSDRSPEQQLARIISAFFRARRGQMKLNEFLKALFSGRGSLSQRSAPLERAYRRLKEVFDQFANNIANGGSDFQSIKDAVQVDNSALGSNLITLRAFGGDEI